MKSVNSWVRKLNWENKFIWILDHYEIRDGTGISQEEENQWNILDGIWSWTEVNILDISWKARIVLRSNLWWIVAKITDTAEKELRCIRQ